MAEIFAKETEGQPSIGEIVFWEINNQEKHERAHVEAKMKMLGINSGDYRITEKRVLRRTVDELKDKKERVTKFIDDDNIVSYGIISEEINTEHMILETETENVFSMNKTSGDLTTKVRNEQFSNMIAENKKTYIGDDFRNIVTKTLTNINGVQLRAHGGIWFIPISEIDQVEKLEEFMECFGQRLVRLKIVDGAKAKTNISNIFYNSLVEQMKSKINDLTEYEKRDNHKGLQKKMDRELAECMNLQTKSNLYSDLLESNSELVKTTREELKKKIMDILKKEDE